MSAESRQERATKLFGTSDPQEQKQKQADLMRRHKAALAKLKERQAAKRQAAR